MDNLEQFYRKKGREKAFDHLELKEDSWEKLTTAMDKKNPPAKKSYWRPMLAAASILLLMAVFFFNSTQETPNTDQIGLNENMFFPEIALKNQHGKLVPLSELKGKVVLVEFWASHSTICTEEQCYYFKPIYNEFKEKGFEIYAVSLDTSAYSWVDVIKREEFDWVQVADLQGTDSPLKHQFEVEELPKTYLLDENGRIIAKDFNADELKDKLDKLLAFKE